MSYGRDPDALHRGVGAIAARDAGNGAALRRRRARARMLSERDRALSRYTYGPYGGIGATDLDRGSSQIPDQPGTGTNPVPGGGGAGGAASPAYTRFVKGWVSSTPSAVKAPLSAGMTNGTGPTMWVDPVRPPNPVRPPAGTGAGMSSSSSGGNAGNTGIVPPTMIVDPLPPDVVIPPVPEGAGGMSNGKKLLIGGAVVGALYLMFRKKKGPTP